MQLSPSGRSMHSQDEGEIVIDHGMVLPFKALSLTFENINYYVDLPKVTIFCLLWGLSLAKRLETCKQSKSSVLTLICVWASMAF